MLANETLENNMSEIKIKKARTQRRINRIRSKILNQEGKLRLTVFASNRAMYAQIIDDSKGQTLVSASVKELSEAKGTKTDVSKALGKLLAEKAKAKKVTDNLVFDKGRFKYHGRVKAFADAAREGGLQF